MRTVLAPLVVTVTLLVSAHASAATAVRPGLWEVRTTSDLLRLIPAIPQDTMQSLMNMARQHGIDMPQIQNGAAISRACISPAMAERQALPILYQHQAGCSTSNATRDGNQYRVEFACSSARVKGNGTAHGTFSNPENFSGQTAFNGNVQGTPVNERADISGRWLEADCGTVRPVQ